MSNEKNSTMKKLITRQEYWIFDGGMKPIKGVLFKLVNEGRTAIFGGLARKSTSVYNSKEEALKINKY